MVTAFVRIDLPDRSPDFQRIALEPGVPLLDRGQTTARLLRVWLGRFAGEPEWVDSVTLQFFVNDDQGRRITATNVRLVSSKDLAGSLRGEIRALRQKLAQIEARGRTEQTVVKLMRERLAALERQPENAFSDGTLFTYRDAKRQWRLVWCWGYQRSESKIVRPAICVKPECRRVYLIRTAEDPKCSKCHTPLPVFHFPWKKVGLVAACLFLACAFGGWRYWSTLPRSSITGQVVWNGFNVPIAGAEIRIESLNVSARTDAHGRFHLEHLPAGNLEVSVIADGFPAWKANHELAQSHAITIPIELAGDGVLNGRVLDSVSHQPLPDVILQITGTSEAITTDAKGQFRREGCRRGPMSLQVVARGYPQSARDITLAETNDDSVDLEVTGDAILVGRVISASHEQPLAEVSIRLESNGQTVKTDSEGWYALRNAPNGIQEVVAEKDGFATERMKKELASAQELQASFKLAGAAKVLGRVVRAADMSPMSGVDVKVGGTRFATKTDDDGRFELRGITAGKSSIEVSAAGFAAVSFERELSNAEETVLPVQLRGDATIVGLVTDEVTKQPVAAVDVRLVGLPYQTRTDAEGKYQLEGVPSLPSRIDARTLGYIAKSTDVRPAAKEKATVPLTILGNSTLAGLVIEHWSEEPVAKARVALGKTGFEVATSDEGAFEIKGVRGGVKHEIQIEAEGLAPQSESIEAKPGPSGPRKIVMTGAGQQAGRVVSAIDDSPIAGAKVQLVGTNHAVTADDKGQYLLDKVRTGRIAFDVSATGFQTRRITEELTAESKPILIRLGGNASVVGEVLDSATGLPVADSEVSIAKTVLKSKTNNQGAYRLEGAFPGNATVTARADGYPSASEQVELVAEREANVDIKLAGTATVSGEVYDDVGKPLENAIIQLEETEHKSATGPRGEFQLTKLRGGTARLNISAPRFVRKSVSVELRLGEAKGLGRLMLSSSLTVNGQVVNAVTGDRLANVKLAIASLGLIAVSDAQGQFKFDGLPAKLHGIKIEAPGYVTEVESVNPMSNEEPVLFALCPVPKADEVLIVLKWRGGPQNLDAHLYHTGATGAVTHVFSGQPQDGNLSAIRTSPNGRGPETLRINPLKPGRYELLVEVVPTAAPPEDTTEALNQLSRSEAMVKIYRLGHHEPATYRVGRNKKATVWWPLGLEIISPDKIIDHVYKAEHYRSSLPVEIAPK